MDIPCAAVRASTLLYGHRSEINVNNQLRRNIASLLNLSLIGSNNKFSHLSGAAEKIALLTFSGHAVECIKYNGCERIVMNWACGVSVVLL